MKMIDKRTILFEHIPKTAGSTFNHILGGYYPNAFLIKGNNPLKSIEKFKGLTKSKQKSFDLVHGHCATELELFLDNPILITFLRDPVEQFISQLFYIKREKVHLYHEDVSRLDSIEEYIQYAKDNFQDNLQCRLLAKDKNWITNEKESVVDMDQLYSIAVKQLMKFDLVLLTERFDESLLLVRHKLRWSKPPYYFRINKTLNRPLIKNIDPSVICQIEALQKYDRMLYDLTCERFQKTIDAFISANELASFQYKNKYYQKLIVPINKLIRKVSGVDRGIL